MGSQKVEHRHDLAINQQECLPMLLWLSCHNKFSPQDLSHPEILVYFLSTLPDCLRPYGL